MTSTGLNALFRSRVALGVLGVAGVLGYFCLTRSLQAGLLFTVKKYVYQVTTLWSSWYHQQLWLCSGLWRSSSPILYRLVKHEPSYISLIIPVKHRLWWWPRFPTALPSAAPHSSSSACSPSPWSSPSCPLCHEVAYCEGPDKPVRTFKVWGRESSKWVS